MFRLEEQYAANDLSNDTIHSLFIQQITILSKRSVRL